MVHRIYLGPIRAYIAAAGLVALLGSSVLSAQSAPSRGGAISTPSELPVFAIHGRVYGDRPNVVPDILEVQLERTSTPVERTFLGSDQSFEFHNLPPGSYNVLIKDERFEDINIGVQVYGQYSQTFYVIAMLTPKKKEATPSQELEADDDLSDAVSVTLLSKKISPKAMKLYRKALELDQHKKYPEAIAELNQAILIDPEFYSAQRNLGILYFLTGEFARSITALQVAMRLNPNSSKVHYFLGLNYLNNNDLGGAQDHFGKAIALAPQKAGPYYFQGYIFYKQNRLADAEKSLKKSLELDNALSSYARLQLSNVYIKESQLQEAYQQMEIFLKEKPGALEVSQVMANLKILREILGPSASHP